MQYVNEISLALIVTVLSIVIVRWQLNQNNTFDISHMLLGEDGKVSLYRFGQAVALVISSWAFVVMVQKNQLTEYYFYGYMGVWSGINLAKNIFGKASDGSTSKT